MTALVITTITANLAFACIVLLILRDSRADREAREVTINRLIADQTCRDARHREEVQTLLQRIQAPDIAVIQHAQEGAAPETRLPVDDDDLAEMQDQEAVAEALARAANVEAELVLG